MACPSSVEDSKSHVLRILRCGPTLDVEALQIEREGRLSLSSEYRNQAVREGFVAVVAIGGRTSAM